MKSHHIVLRFRAINLNTFLSIKNGKKKVETRAATKRYRNIRVGDTIVFVCGKKKFERHVKKVQWFKAIPAMLKVYSVKNIMPNLKTTKELISSYYAYPNYKQKIKKYGLIAIESQTKKKL